ncbi:hypothetical protein DFH27DRAFT_209959 [Peziza echinospora]|nr:hypothetical protein DFH27DRAFT_209959 [Peziza echinospora]
MEFACREKEVGCFCIVRARKYSSRYGNLGRNRTETGSGLERRMRIESELLRALMCCDAIAEDKPRLFLVEIYFSVQPHCSFSCPDIALILLTGCCIISTFLFYSCKELRLLIHPQTTASDPDCCMCPTASHLFRIQLECILLWGSLGYS